MYIFHSCASLHVVWLCREAKKAVVILESLTQLPPPSPRRTQTPTFNNKGNSSLGFLRPVTQSVWSTITPHLVLEPHGQSKLKASTLYDKKPKLLGCTIYWQEMYCWPIWINNFNKALSWLWYPCIMTEIRKF